MRFVGTALIVFALALTFVVSGFGPAAIAQQAVAVSSDDGDRDR